MSRLLRAVDTQAESLGSFVFHHKEAGFRANHADGDAHFSADDDEDALPLTPEQARARIEEEAFALGFAEGRREVEAEYDAERDALARLALSLQVLKPEPANALALLLAETVDRLVREICGQVEVDPGLLLARAQQAAALVAKDVEPTRLRAHPDDLVHLEGIGLAPELEADAVLPRGTLVLETGHGWIEDGPAVRLERLRAELDRMGAPQ